MNSMGNVDVQNIISVIRAEINESSMDDLLAFEEIPIRNTPNIREARCYINVTINEQIQNIAQFFARFETFSIRKIKKYLDFRFINK